MALRRTRGHWTAAPVVRRLGREPHWQPGWRPWQLGPRRTGRSPVPASLNGVAGIKPAVGSVPTQGVVPISFSQDSPGPMARTVDEVALLLEVLAATEGILDRARQGPGGLRIGVATTWRTGHPATDELFAGTVARLVAAGANVHDVAPGLPSPNENDDEQS